MKINLVSLFLISTLSSPLDNLFYFPFISGLSIILILLIVFASASSFVYFISILIAGLLLIILRDGYVSIYTIKCLFSISIFIALLRLKSIAFFYNFKTSMVFFGSILISIGIINTLFYIDSIYAGLNFSFSSILAKTHLSYEGSSVLKWGGLFFADGHKVWTGINLTFTLFVIYEYLRIFDKFIFIRLLLLINILILYSKSLILYYAFVVVRNSKLILIGSILFSLLFSYYLAVIFPDLARGRDEIFRNSNLSNILIGGGLDEVRVSLDFEMGFASIHNIFYEQLILFGLIPLIVLYGITFILARRVSNFYSSVGLLIFVSFGVGSFNAGDISFFGLCGLFCHLQASSFKRN